MRVPKKVERILRRLQLWLHEQQEKKERRLERLSEESAPALSSSTQSATSPVQSSSQPTPFDEAFEPTAEKLKMQSSVAAIRARRSQVVTTSERAVTSRKSCDGLSSDKTRQ